MQMNTAMKKQTRDFDTDAAKWDEQPARVKLAEDVVRAITQHIPLSADMELLDFGCGTGLVALKLAPFVRSVTGADSSRGMLNVLRAKIEKQGLANVHAKFLSPGDALDAAYDVIVSNMAFHHIEHIESLLAQLYGALKNPGYLCVADLDSEQGEFHEDNTGVFHFGFDRVALHESFKNADFIEVKDVTATDVAKPTRSGALRTFRIFLMVGKKPKADA